VGSFKRFLYILSEMSFDKKVGENKIRDLSEQILLHLIKILKWEDKINYSKHINDINNWLQQIQDIRINKKLLKANRYYRLIYDEPIGDDVLLVDSRIKRRLKNYHSLNVITDNHTDIMNMIHKIIKKVSVDISKNEFESVKNYL